MYVCLCRGITEEQIATAVKRGAGSLNDVRARLNVANQCGQCAEMASQIIDDTLSAIEATTVYYQVA